MFTVLGQKGKWIIITCVQLLKCAARLALLLHYKQNLLSCPPIAMLQRNQKRTARNLDGSARINNIAFSLKRSGRIIRKVETGKF